MSDEQTPDPLAKLFANLDGDRSAPAPLVPTTPQFSSRRAIRDAAAKPSRRTAQPAPRSAPPTRAAKLSHKDKMLARRLTVTPRTAATAPGKKPREKKHPIKVMLVLLVISGFVGGIALPAVALTAGSGGQSQTLIPTSARGKQSLKVDATIQAQSVSRDQVSATSEQELKAEQINAATLISAPGKKAAGDDYPWRDAGYGLSPLNYYYRQCVDFVAWRLNRDAGVTSAPWKWTWATLTPGGGDASQWKSAWETHGWKTSATPVVGAVAWFVGNHVAYVNSIQGSNVVIEEYNGMSSRAYAERTIPIDSVGRFLYPPPA